MRRGGVALVLQRRRAPVRTTAGMRPVPERDSPQRKEMRFGRKKPVAAVCGVFEEC